MTADSTDFAGSVIADRFEVVRVIGRGGNGAVCEVVDRTTGRSAALKMIVGEDADLAARLEREGIALGMLGHPHVVALVDAGRTAEGTPYLATELVRGSSLRDVLDHGAIPPRRALGIAQQLLEALVHVHGAGMIHRDIKPDNIMLAEHGQPDRADVKLLDFGVAKVIDPDNDALGSEKLTRAGLEVLGSPPYIAPETAIGEPIDARTDLYSVGIVLFEMIAGRTPFHDDDRTTLLRKHVTDPVPPLHVAAPDDVPAAALEAIVARALAKLPDQRFPSAMDMHAAVARALHAPEPQIASTRPPVATRARQLARRARHVARELVVLSRRYPRSVAAIATAVVVLVLVIAIASRHSPTASGPSSPAPAAPAEPAAAARRWVEQADSDRARHRYGRAIAGYERAVAADRTLASDAKLRTAVAQIARDGDAVAAAVGLELLATRLDPPDHKTIAELAATGRLLDVRQRAFAIAERDGFSQSIDQLASWTLDLKQQTTCDDRRETIAKLRDLGDARAVDVLQRARTLYPCVAKDAAAAIAQLQPAKK